MNTNSRHAYITNIFKIALFMEFFGHGSFGILKKQGWLPFYHVFGLPDDFAFLTMPVVGIHDILLAFLVLVRPTPVAFLWMGFWGFFTASLRPMAGQGVLEFFERSYNYGIPLLAFYMSLQTAFPVYANWFKKSKFDIDKKYVVLVLRGIAFSALISHALLILFFKTEKIMAYSNMQALGENFKVIGIVEIACAIGVLFLRNRPILWSILIFKALLEASPIIGGQLAGWIEFIERGSCYFAIFLLIDYLKYEKKEARSVFGAVGAGYVS